MLRGKAEQTEQIIPKLRVVAVELGRGKTGAEAVKKIVTTNLPFERWTEVLGSERPVLDPSCLEPPDTPA